MAPAGSVARVVPVGAIAGAVLTIAGSAAW
jgi:hypothetical protein